MKNLKCKLASTHSFHPFAIQRAGAGGWHDMAMKVTQHIAVTEDNFLVSMPVYSISNRKCHFSQLCSA